MVLQRGDQVREFTAQNQSGQIVASADIIAAGPTVFFFYPKAMTPGCTKESCHFRDLAGEFDAAGGQLFGVSADSPERQAEFDQKHSLGIPLLSDPARDVAKIFGVKRLGPILNRRATFVVDTNGIVVDSLSSEFNMNQHADWALEVIKSMTNASSPDSSGS